MGDAGSSKAREVWAGPGMGYYFRAGIETRTKRGREQFRFVGEYRFVGWSLSGPGLPFGKRSRWFKTRDEAAAAANAWLDGKEWHSPDLEYVREEQA